jgi:hypothetical protein
MLTGWMNTIKRGSVRSAKYTRQNSRKGCVNDLILECQTEKKYTKNDELNQIVSQIMLYIRDTI